MPWRLVPEILPSYQFSSTLRMSVILSPCGQRLDFGHRVTKPIPSGAELEYMTANIISLLSLTFLKDISTTVSPLKLKRATASPYSSTCTGTLFFGWAFSVTGSSWRKRTERTKISHNKNHLRASWNHRLRTHTPPHSSEGKCPLCRGVPLHTSFDPPVEWCKQCLLSEMAAPYKWREQ